MNQDNHSCQKKYNKLYIFIIFTYYLQNGEMWADDIGSKDGGQSKCLVVYMKGLLYYNEKLSSKYHIRLLCKVEDTEQPDPWCDLFFPEQTREKTERLK